MQHDDKDNRAGANTTRLSHLDQNNLMPDRFSSQLTVTEQLEVQIRELESQSGKIELLLQAMQSGTLEDAKQLLSKLRSGVTIEDIIQPFRTNMPCSASEEFVAA